MTIDNPLYHSVEEITDSIKHQMEGRSYRVANEMRNASQLVLRGARSGKRYKVPGTYRKQRDPYDGKIKRGRYYTASAPGEPPANRLGNFRRSWQPTAFIENGNYISRIESDTMTENGRHNLGEILEHGTEDGRIAPRPFEGPIMDKAKPKIARIYNQPYF